MGWAFPSAKTEPAARGILGRIVQLAASNEYLYTLAVVAVTFVGFSTIFATFAFVAARAGLRNAIVFL